MVKLSRDDLKNLFGQIAPCVISSTHYPECRSVVLIGIFRNFSIISFQLRLAQVLRCWLHDLIMNRWAVWRRDMGIVVCPTGRVRLDSKRTFICPPLCGITTLAYLVDRIPKKLWRELFHVDLYSVTLR